MSHCIIHLFCPISWLVQSMVAVAFFLNDDSVSGMRFKQSGLFHGGGGLLLGAQMLACICVIIWCGGVALGIIMVLHFIFLIIIYASVS